MDDRAEPASGAPDSDGPAPGWPATVRHLRDQLADTLLVCDAVLYRTNPSANLLKVLRRDARRLEQALRHYRQDSTGLGGRDVRRT